MITYTVFALLLAGLAYVVVAGFVDLFWHGGRWR